MPTPSLLIVPARFKTGRLYSQIPTNTDNRIAMNSGWDMEMLANELSDLHADEIDLGLMGFEVDELETLLGIESSDDESTNENNGLQVGNIEYRVVTQVASEAAQAALIDELEKRGFTCQPLMS